MILLKLKRDQARCIDDYFFPYMIAVAVMKMNNAGKLSDEYLNAKVLYTLIIEVEKIFRRKLASEANKFNFKLNDAQGITFDKFLMNHPMNAEEFYLNHLRQHIIDVLFKQIII